MVETLGRVQSVIASDHPVSVLPPHHSKYNPVERLWGRLERFWRGELIDSVEKALGLARSMTYKELPPQFAS